MTESCCFPFFIILSCLIIPCGSSFLRFCYPCGPKNVRLMNTGMPLSAYEDTPPYMIVENGMAKGPLLRITGMPSDREPLLTEPTVVEVEW